MPLAPANTGKQPASSPYRLSARDTLLLAAWFGLVAGYLNVGAIILAKHGIHSSPYYRLSRDFPWTVPVSDLAIVMVPGLVAAAMNRLRAGLVSARAAGCWRNGPTRRCSGR